MASRYRWLEPLLLSASALALLVAGGILLRHRLPAPPSAVGARELWARTVGLVLLAYGIGVAVLTSSAVAAIQRRAPSLATQSAWLLRSVVHESRDLLRGFGESVGSRRAALGISIITAAGLALRARFLSQPMRYDEAYTFLNYVNVDARHLFAYTMPNNHVFHTLLVWLSTTLLGGHAASIRLPALLAGVMAIPSLFYLARGLGERRGGFLAAALAAVFPYLVLYDTMARGYSLVVLLSLVLGLIGMRLVQRPSVPLCFLMSLAGALGTLTMPSFLFVLAGMYLWLAALMLINTRSPSHLLRAFAFPCVGMTVMMIAVFYTPTIVASNGIRAIAGNRFVISLPWAEFAPRAREHFPATLTEMLHGIPVPAVALLTVLVLLGILQSLRKRMWDLLLMLPSLTVGAVAVLLLTRAVPFTRTWIYLIPFVLILADTGFSWVTGFVRPSARRWLHVSGVALVCYFAVSLATRDALPSRLDAGDFPEARAVAQFLSTQVSQGDRVEAKCPANAPLQFYLWQMRVPARISRMGRPTRRGSLGDQASKTFFVVKAGSYWFDKIAELGAPRIFKIGNAEVYVSEPSTAPSPRPAKTPSH
jgi:hypothetical protein